MAALLFAIVLVFFVCHAPKAVINIYEVFENLRSAKCWITVFRHFALQGDVYLFLSTGLI